MSIAGASFTGGAAGAHVELAAGGAASAPTGAHTIAVLMHTNSGDRGLISAWSGAVGTGPVADIHVFNGGPLFGLNDFSAGYSDVDDDAWRWVVLSKPAGSAHFRWHVADLATLTWSHGEAASSGNHGNQSAASSLALGCTNDYALGFGSTHLAAAAIWTSELSDSAIVAACTQAAVDLAAAAPAAGWLLKQADVGSAGSIVDFTGGGADETSRTSIVTSTDPVDFDFTLAPPQQGEVGFAATVGLTATATLIAQASVAFAVTVGLNFAAGGAGRPFVSQTRPGLIVSQARVRTIESQTRGGRL